MGRFFRGRAEQQQCRGGKLAAGPPQTTANHGQSPETQNPVFEQGGRHIFTGIIRFAHCHLGAAAKRLPEDLA